MLNSSAQSTSGSELETGCPVRGSSPSLNPGIAHPQSIFFNTYGHMERGWEKALCTPNSFRCHQAKGKGSSFDNTLDHKGMGSRALTIGNGQQGIDHRERAAGASGFRSPVLTQLCTPTVDLLMSWSLWVLVFSLRRRENAGQAALEPASFQTGCWAF